MSVFSSHPPSFISDYGGSSMYDSAVSTTSTTTAMGASFQIINPNPALSSLPPRSRTSVGTSSPPSKRNSLQHSVSAPGPNTKFITAGKEKDKAREKEARLSREFEDELEREVQRRAGPGEVWNALLLSAKGREKTMKVIQYTLKVYLLAHSRTVGAMLTKTRSNALHGNLQHTVSSLSLYRKITIMFGWIAPLNQVLNPPSLPFQVTASTTPFGAAPPSKQMAPSILQKLLRAPPPVLLSLLQSFSDDVYALSLLRLVPSGVGRRANRLANWCWLFSTLAQLVENGAERTMVRQLVKEVQEKIYEGELEGRDLEKEGCGDVEEGERELDRLTQQLAWIDRARMKLYMDLIYVSYEVFNFKQYRQPVMATTGLVAGVLSTARLYEQHRQELLKNATAEQL